MSDRLTAMDIENQKFPRKLRGYAREEVRMYLASVAEEIQRLNLANAELREEAGRLRDDLEAMKSRERTLQETLVSAQKMSGEMKDQAKRDSDLLLREARMRAERMLEQAQDQLARIEDEISRAKLERDAFESRLRSAAEEHIAMLDLRARDRESVENLHFLHRKTGSEAG
jgi:cell division initiation protein